MPDLKERLKSEGYNFNFFQALALLEEHFRNTHGIANPIESGKIRMTSSASLAFPPSDIEKVFETKNGIEMVLSFMGLVGVSSPLPLYFTEYIARHEENGIPLRDFLSMFNHRIYTLFYRAWQKYRFISMSRSTASHPMTRVIASLAGMDASKLSDPLYLKMLAYTGSLAGKARGKESLRCMLSDFFGDLPVTIEQYKPRWVDITEVPKIGVNSQLGLNSICGTKKWDIAGKFRASIGPLSRERFETFLPGTDNIAAVKKLISQFLNDPLDFDIEVKLESHELIPVIVGTDNTRLGQTSSLGISEMKSEIQSIVIA